MKTEQQRLEKDPDRRVQQAILLVFRKFLEIGTVRQTLMWFLEHSLELPVHGADGQTRWRRPSYGNVYGILTHPAYSGAYVYGRNEKIVQYEDGEPRQGSRRRPRQEWLSLIPHAHEGYVSWEQFEKIQSLIAGNNRGGVKRVRFNLDRLCWWVCCDAGAVAADSASCTAARTVMWSAMRVIGHGWIMENRVVLRSEEWHSTMP